MGLTTVTLKGIDGAREIEERMKEMRANPPKELGGYAVLAVRDYKAGVRTELATGRTEQAGLPVSNVLYYELENQGWCCVRPSGTEPKIKYYYGVKGDSREDAAERLEKVQRALIGE